MELLIFDDDPAIGRLVIRVAQAMGLAATAVADVKTFRQMLGRELPRIIVLDLQLGDTDGVVQLRYLVERQFAGSLILMSGFDERVLATTSSLALSMGLNVATTLPKPIRIEALEGALSTAMSTADETPSIDRLMKAIHDGELRLEFQPVVSRHPRTLTKLEALVRWEHPTIGHMAPDSFIPLAESDATVIDTLTNWVIGAAL